MWPCHPSQGWSSGSLSSQPANMQLELLFFVSKQSERSRPSPARLSVAWKTEHVSYFAHTVLRWLLNTEMNSRNACVKAVNSDGVHRSGHCGEDFCIHVFLDGKRILERLGQSEGMLIWSSLVHTKGKWECSPCKFHVKFQCELEHGHETCKLPARVRSYEHKTQAYKYKNKTGPPRGEHFWRTNLKLNHKL